MKADFQIKRTKVIRLKPWKEMKLSPWTISKNW